MSDAKHTPGPWEVDEHDQIIVGGETTYGGRFVVCRMGNLENPQIAADARLIAAAPDLLKACEEMLYHASLGPDEAGRQEWNDDCRRMEAAIRAARGEGE